MSSATSRPNIVVLDGHTLNPGDLDWHAIEALGALTVHARTDDEEIIARAANADILLTNKTAITAETIAALPNVRFIGVLATGHNVVDSVAARERNIPVTNIPDYGTPAVAQAVFALLLEMTNRTGHHAQAVRAGRWTNSADWCFWDFPLIELNGLTLGLIGYGKIAQAVARIALAMGMKVIAHRRSAAAARDGEVTFTDLETLLRTSDVVSFHCPLTEENKGMLNAQRLALMKPTAFVINTGRGPLMDEAALAEALNQGRLAGAGLDVLSAEPPPASNPLLQAKNCFITPHIAWAARNARARLINTAAANLRGFLAGKPVNLVN